MDFFYRLDGSLNDLPALCEMKNCKSRENETYSEAASIFHKLVLRCLAEIAQDKKHTESEEKTEDILAEAFIMITRLSLITTDEKEMREALAKFAGKLKYDMGMV